MERAPEGSSTASCCGERSGCLFSPFTLSGRKQRDLVGRHWERSRRGQRHWLWMGTGGFCMAASIAKGGPLFSFFPFLQACLPYSLPTNYYYYHLFSDIALSSYIPVMSYVHASSLPCGLWCLWSSILATGILTGFFLIPPHILLEHCLGKEAASLLLIPSAKLMWKQFFGLFIFPIPSKSSYFSGEKRRTGNPGAPCLNS